MRKCWELPGSIFRRIHTYLLLFIILVFSAATHANLTPFWQDSGQISVSVDAFGNNAANGGVIHVNKPEGAIVKKAFLMSASNYSREIVDGDVILDGNPIEWDKSIFNSLIGFENFFNSTLADVTELISEKINSAPPGLIEFSVEEIQTVSIDGEILVVIFDDPNQLEERGVVLLFGGQDTLGDSFIINLAEPIDVTDPDTIANAGIGISFGYQNTPQPSQFSLIDVNGQRLTSSAGGEDDGASYDGGLITVGGIGDSIANPSPFAPPLNPRTDDELYDLKEFMAPDDNSILFSTINESDDDNILFAYFFTSGASAVLPPLDPPGPRSLQTSDLIGFVDPSKPTIVLTHGLQAGSYDDGDESDLWTSFAENKAASLIYDQIGSDANILQYIWEEAFQGLGGASGPAYIRARSYISDAAANLTKRLVEELGTGYSHPIHFIGHSLGTAVNAYAAREFLNLQPQIQQAQVTILDYPNLVENIPNLNPAEAEIYGFDENFFSSVLPVADSELDLKVDNYFVRPEVCILCTGVGERANGKIYNHVELVNPNDIDDKIFEGEFVSNDHTGVQQWYRWTIAPNELYPGACDPITSEPADLPWNFDQSLNPCKVGWHWATNGPSADQFPENNGDPIALTDIRKLHLERFTDFGCYQDFDESINCTEQSSPFGTADINIPADASFLSFSYEFIDLGDGDYAAIFIDDYLFWVMAGSSRDIGQITDSGPIPVRGLTGPRKILIALYGVGEKNAEIILNDFQTSKVDDSPNSPPIADAGPDQVVTLGDVVYLDGSNSYDPDEGSLVYSWEIIEGENVLISDSETAFPSFTTTEVGWYTVKLTVSDGELSASDTVGISVQYDFSGFSHPIASPPEWNEAKAGRVIPIKFSIDGYHGTDIFKDAVPVSQDVPCFDQIGVGPSQYIITAGNSGLNYDYDEGQYNYIWKTKKSWKGTCRHLIVELQDGTKHKAFFDFTQ